MIPYCAQTLSVQKKFRALLEYPCNNYRLAEANLTLQTLTHSCFPFNITHPANRARRRVVELLRAKEDEIVGQYKPPFNRSPATLSTEQAAPEQAICPPTLAHFW
jgi:hypothetical protein